MPEQESNQAEPLWTDDDVARYLRVSVQTVQKWAKNGDIPVRKAGSLNRFDRSEIDEWTRAGRMPVAEGAA
jgi:PTS system nitrogen regulatory IIA component